MEEKEEPRGIYPTHTTTPLAFPDHMKDYAALREHIKALTSRKAVKTLKAKLHICLLHRKEADSELLFRPARRATFPPASDQNRRQDGGRAVARLARWPPARLSSAKNPGSSFPHGSRLYCAADVADHINLVPIQDSFLRTLSQHVIKPEGGSRVKAFCTWRR